jgi:hypothetical protein
MQASPDSREFYVYLIFRPDGRPCYVGKGKGGRWESHFQRAGNPWLSRIIAAAGGELPVVKIRENLTEEEAFETEVAWIAAIGRKKGGGPLVNLTDGGDGTTGLVHSLGTRARLSEARKAMWQDPEARARLSEARKTMWQDPDHQARISEASKALWQDPDYQARMSEARKAMWQDPDYQARMSEAAKTRLASPETRARMSEAAKAALANPEVRARVSEARKAMWQDPDYQARIAEAAKSPETRARRSEARKAMWRTPDFRAKWLATRARTRALKKAAKEVAD